jgi:DHA2 family multidrug resistance protein
MLLPPLEIREEIYKWWALVVVIIGGFMSILDTSIVNVAIPKMMAVFGVGTDDAEWILTAYMLTMGVIQPATGYLADVYGTRRMYLFSLAVFTIGSALCGIAWSNESMIGFRIIQALGGGMIIPISMSIVYQVFAPRERNMALGLWGISAMVAPAIGPTLSGYLVESWDWRWIFMINIPVGILGYMASALILRESKLVKGKKFDYGGCITSTVGLFSLLLALSQGVDKGWSSGYIISLFYLAFANLAIFVAIELHHPEPIMDLSLFKDWNFTFSTLVIFVGTISLFGGIFLIPLFMENLRGYTAMQTGMLMLPAAAISGLMMPVAAKLADKFGAKPVVIMGITILSIASAPFIYIDLDISYQTIMIVMILRGLGLGLFMMPVTVLGMNTVPHSKISRAASLNNAIRQISSSLGIALLTTILQNRHIFHMARAAEAINQQSYATTKFLTYGKQLFMHNGFVEGAAKIHALQLAAQFVNGQTMVFAFDDAFASLVVICSIGIIPAVLLKKAKKHHAEAPVMIE